MYQKNQTCSFPGTPYSSFFILSFPILARIAPNSSSHWDRINCRSIFYDVLATMAADWKEAAISELHIMMRKANLSRRFSNVIIGLHAAAVFTYGIGVLVSHTDNYVVDGVETPVREFPLKLQLPFECNESPMYELLTSLEFFHQSGASVMTGVLNSLIITLVSAICERRILSLCLGQYLLKRTW